MSSAPAAPEHLLVLEAGSNSLKMYVVDPGGGEKAIEVFKYPWSVAHEFFSTGNFSPATFTEICNCIRAAAKDAGRGRIVEFDAALERLAHERLALQTDLRRALEDAHQGRAGVAAGEGLALRPGDEGGAILPRGVRDVLALVVAAEQGKADEAGHLVQVRISLGPDALEVLALAGRHLEPVHGDEHGASCACSSIVSRDLGGVGAISGGYLSENGG